MFCQASATAKAAVFPSANAGNTLSPSRSLLWRRTGDPKGGDNKGMGFPRSVTQSDAVRPATLPLVLACSRRSAVDQSLGTDDGFADSQPSDSRPTQAKHQNGFIWSAVFVGPRRSAPAVIR